MTPLNDSPARRVERNMHHMQKSDETNVYAFSEIIIHDPNDQASTLFAISS